MANRDVDSVDPALPKVPERIELAERWRLAGKIIATRSPEVFAECVALFEAWAVNMADKHEAEIDKLYLER